MINAFQKKILQTYNGDLPTYIYHYIILRHLHLYHQKSINLHSLICYVLEYDSKIGNDKNIQSYTEKLCTRSAIFIVYNCHMI